MACLCAAFVCATCTIAGQCRHPERLFGGACRMQGGMASRALRWASREAVISRRPAGKQGNPRNARACAPARQMLAASLPRALILCTRRAADTSNRWQDAAACGPRAAAHLAAV